MKKNNSKYKEWLKRRLRKKERNRIKKNKSSNSTKVSSSTVTKTEKGRKSFSVKAPQHFSIKENPKDTIEFFDAVVNFMNTRKEGVNIYFDISDVVTVTDDAIIYLLAIIKDLQKLGYARHNCLGNLPKNSVAKEYFVQSGFLNHVNSNIINLRETDNLQIRSGKIYQQTITKDICDYVCAHVNKSIVFTKFLYVLINEMMLNTYQHAYHKNGDTLSSWYVSVRTSENKIQFTFVDTGFGIPKTVRKKWTEKIFSTESSMVKSALNGEFRTQTGNTYRGKGLPKIRDCVDKSYINELYVISNKAFCKVNKSNNEVNISEMEQTKSLMGTIYCWEINIQGE